MISCADNSQLRLFSFCMEGWSANGLIFITVKEQNGKNQKKCLSFFKKKLFGNQWK